jgi:hypothetical protein
VSPWSTVRIRREGIGFIGQLAVRLAEPVRTPGSNALDNGTACRHRRVEVFQPVAKR